MQGEDLLLGWLRFFFAGWGIGFLIYVMVQSIFSIVIGRKYRALILLPVPFMFGVLVWTVYAFSKGSNLWPIVMIFTSPVAVLGLIVLWLVARHAQKVAAVSEERSSPMA